jgi:hypothetical protein
MKVSIIPHSQPLESDRQPLFINSNSIVRSSSSAPVSAVYAESASTPNPSTIPPFSSTRFSAPTSDNTVHQFGISSTTEVVSSTVEEVSSAPSEQQENVIPTDTPDLASILKKHGLFAMAKYLKQSGLDAILNETGPYTIFVPTDKAFKSLLVQLGGPDKAEEKFKNNPRLLSGVS